MSKIGVFDSGYGGLTVLRSLVKELPEYDYIYLGDNARSPYGGRSFDTVFEYTKQAVIWFFEHHQVDLVIIACNTASAKALRQIQQTVLPDLFPNKRVLGVIRPTTETLGKFSNNGVVGVLGTEGTIKSDSYKIELNKFFPSLLVYQESCPLWVHLVENNVIDTPGSEFFIEYHVNKILSHSNNIDTLLLACTHYPLLENSIKKIIPDGVKIISQGPIVAKSLRDYLQRHPEIKQNLSEQSMREFFTTDYYADFDSIGSRFFGEEIKSKRITL